MLYCVTIDLPLGVVRPVIFALDANHSILVLPADGRFSILINTAVFIGSYKWRAFC